MRGQRKATDGRRYRNWCLLPADGHLVASEEVPSLTAWRCEHSEVAASVPIKVRTCNVSFQPCHGIKYGAEIMVSCNYLIY